MCLPPLLLGRHPGSAATGTLLEAFCYRPVGEVSVHHPHGPRILRTQIQQHLGNWRPTQPEFPTRCSQPMCTCSSSHRQGPTWLHMPIHVQDLVVLREICGLGSTMHLHQPIFQPLLFGSFEHHLPRVKNRKPGHEIDDSRCVSQM